MHGHNMKQPIVDEFSTIGLYLKKKGMPFKEFGSFGFLFQKGAVI